METLLLKFGYFAIFPITYFEGQISTLLCGFLVSTGFFKLRIVFLLIRAADIACDNTYYRIGRGAFKSKKLSAIVDRSKFLSGRITVMKDLWDKHPMRTMIIGKNSYIISVAIVASSGMVKMPYHRFLMYSIPAALVQPIVLLFIGYNLGNGYKLAANYIQYPGIALAIVSILILILYRKVNKHITKDFEIKNKKV